MRLTGSAIRQLVRRQAVANQLIERLNGLLWDVADNPEVDDLAPGMAEKVRNGWMFSDGPLSQRRSTRSPADGLLKEIAISSHHRWWVGCFRPGAAPTSQWVEERSLRWVRQDPHLRGNIQQVSKLSRWSALPIYPGSGYWVALQPVDYREGKREVCPHCGHTEWKNLGRRFVFVALIIGDRENLLQVDWFVYQVG